MHPDAGHLVDAESAAALRDLVFVVREDQVDAAAVDVDGRLAEQAQRHRRALDVPARTSLGLDAVDAILEMLLVVHIQTYSCAQSLAQDVVDVV